MLRYKKLDPNASDLTKPTNGNAGYDLATNEYICLVPDVWVEASTGIAIEIPKGYVGLVRGRSGMAFKYSVVSFDGTIDSNYRGEIKLLIRYEPNKDYRYFARTQEFRKYDRVAQLVIVPYLSDDVELVNDLSVSDRGVNGFGSTGL